MIPSDRRTTRARPCPACGHPRAHRTGHCIFLAGGDAVWCANSPVFSGRPGLPRKSGWVHRLTTIAAPVAYVRPAAPAPPDRSAFPALGRRLACSAGTLAHLAGKLHLSPEAVARFRPCWADAIPEDGGAAPPHYHIDGTTTPCRLPGVWLFPMSRLGISGASPTPRPLTVGFRVRTLAADKYSVRDSDGDGLFIPTRLSAARGGLLLCPEGPTSAAALCQLGFVAIGRPNNRAGVQNLRHLIRYLRPARVVVFGDNDERITADGRFEWPGLEGATSTATALRGLRCATSVALPPAGIKDARAWVIAGATAVHVHHAIHAYTPRPHHITPEGACA